MRGWRIATDVMQRVLATLFLLVMGAMLVIIPMWYMAVGPGDAQRKLGQPLPVGWEAAFRPKPNSQLMRWRLGSVPDHPIRFTLVVGAFVTIIVVGNTLKSRREPPKPVPMPAGSSS